MRPLISLICMLGLCLNYSPTLAQAPRLQMELIGTKDGLPNSLCSALLQDQLGYVWIGTGDGLARYDGYEFVAFQAIPGDSNSLQGKVIAFIMEDRKNDLWLGSDGGLHRYDRGRKAFVNIPGNLFGSDSSENQRTKTIHHIFEDGKGQIWTVSGGEFRLHRLSPGSRQPIRMKINVPGAPAVRVGKAHTYAPFAPIMEDHQGQIWCGSLGQGLLRYDAKNDGFEEVPLDQSEARGLDTIYALVEDANHHLWLGTPQGIYRYEPENETVVPFAGSDGRMVEREPVYHLEADAKGDIWVHQSFALKRLDPSEQVIQEYLTLPSITIGTFPNRVHFFVPMGHLPDGSRYWYHPLIPQTIYRYEPTQEQVKLMVLNAPEKSEQWVGPWLGTYSGLVDRSGFVWLGGDFELQKGKPGLFAFDTQLIPEGQGKILEDSKQRVWVSSPEGVYQFKPNDNGFAGMLRPLIRAGLLGGGVGAYNAHTIFESSQGDLWIGTINGLMRIDTETLPESFYNLALGKPVRTSSIEVGLLLLPDFAGDGDLLTRWCSEFSDPQWIEVDLGKPQWIESIVLHWETSSAKAYQILLSDDQQNWRTVFATQNGQGGKETLRIQARGRYVKVWGQERNSPYGYSLWEMEVLGKSPEFTFFQHQPGDPASLPGNEVWELMEDREGTIWITSSGGLSRYLPEKEKFETFPFEQEEDFTPLNPRFFSLIEEDAEGRIWLLRQNNRGVELRDSIYSFNKNTRSFSPPLQFPEMDSKTPFWVLDMDLDSQNRLWISSSRGLCLYHPETGEKKVFLPGISISCWLEDRKGGFWVATRNQGLFHLESDGSIAHSYPLLEGRPFPGIRTLDADESGRIWLGTSKGLVCFYPDEERFALYDREHGLFGDRIWESYQDSEGRIYFYGDEGFTLLDPQRPLQDSVAPSVVLSELRIANQTIDLNSPRSPLSRDIGLTRALSLSHDQNSISLGFTAIHFQNPEANQYRVMLEGLDTSWVDLGTQRNMNYAGLQPGDYTFKVKGSNAGGIWSSQATELKITIHPPWYWAWWSQTLYVLAFIGLMYAFFQWRTHSLRRQRELLQERVEEQTLELREAKQAAEAANEAKSTFLSTVSHELRTPLTSIIGFTKLNKKSIAEKVLPKIDPEDAKTQKTLQRVNKNLDVVSSEGERLTLLINELLDLAKIESGKVDWKMVELQPAALIERAVNATSALFEQKPSLKLVTEVPDDLPTITGDRDRLLQVLINLISNAVKFTDSGRITLAAGISPSGRGKGEESAVHPPAPASGGYGDAITFSVSDTGSGIPQNQLSKVFEKFQQVEDNQAGKPKGTGLGLPICKEIVEHHGGRIWVESEFGKGSSFFVSIPLNDKS
jgi:signal transduction histidine kinase/ligand-binding sensor domain-containing protein